MNGITVGTYPIASGKRSLGGHHAPGVLVRDPLATLRDSFARLLGVRICR
ncbi:hypothetical protein QTQ03_18895 [Micromonospora sp. WMMA1363]|nr:hypothetical protein [Micromonospora sp. WMMA1363]MDM4721556.1 hypothetical protein [Micromonospora sp. WMMA1363]